MISKGKALTAFLSASAMSLSFPGAYGRMGMMMGNRPDAHRLLKDGAEGCPFLAQLKARDSTMDPLPGMPSSRQQQAYLEAVKLINWEDVKMDLKALFRDSKDYWPADYGHYGGLMIRLAWHAAGTYRKFDGRGGSDGGAQRFDPERSWDDNTNLDKARRLLEPLKQKYGAGLSWGDLIVLAGTTAIEDMGGDVLGFCAGRMDFIDNTQTLPLGPTPEQEAYAECPVQGECPEPLGTNTLGLIYVNPEGPLANPDPQGAAETIRDVFGRMEMTEREHVALIGGGHSFGKSHGAGPGGAGPSPAEDPVNPWPGNFQSGVGNDAVTSGIEGPWTSNPTEFDNIYFRYLLDFQWEAHIGSGGKWQWRVKDGESPKAPLAHPAGTNETQDIMMLTTDVALVVDKDYRVYVEEFANNQTAFAEAFAAVWYKLVTRDMGPHARCLGADVPPPQDFQYPLPAQPEMLADMGAVESNLETVVAQNPDGEFLRLAQNCASTFRITDYQGGCNGARIRFPPGSEWDMNAGLNRTLNMLEPVKEEFGDGLSWADLIVLAGNVAAKDLGAPSDLPFCAGRTDAVDGSGWNNLDYFQSRTPESVEEIVRRYERTGLTDQEFAVWSLFPMHNSTESLQSEFLNNQESFGSEQNDTLRVALRFHPKLQVWTEYYAGMGNGVYQTDFGLVWNKMMVADRFDGPAGNVCSV